MTLDRDIAVVPSSLRERKKQATRLALRRIALDLVAERGFSQVTIDDIAAAADVSPRTFFNYFPTKEAALFGASAGRLEALRDGIVHDAPGESALAALRAALVNEARARAADLSDLGGDPVNWLRRMKSLHSDVHLRAALASHMAMVERVITEALAERLGTDSDRDPYPALLAAASTGVMRSTMGFWADAGGALALDQLTDLACQALAAGLPEDCALRDLSLHTVVAAAERNHHS
jgi:AcrR family transcriptional regulator